MYKTLVINIGSTSTKVGAFIGPDTIFRKTVEHSFEDLSRLNDHEDWLVFHRDVIENVVLEKSGELDLLSLVISRGGLTGPVHGGAYGINDAMLRTLAGGDYGWHPSNVGPPIAREIADLHGVKAIIYDSPVSDELEPLARFSGLKEIERQAGLHVLSQKSSGRKAAREIGVGYDEGNFIVAHLGGGITIGAHQRGMIVDGTHGLSEGPFTPQRTGSLPMRELIRICYSGEYKEKELERMIFSRGGVYSYLETHNVEEVERRVARGDDRAFLVLKAMAYQISKEICALAGVLAGNIDAVVLTGNLCRAVTVVSQIRERVRFLGPLFIYPGEDELENLSQGGLNILEGREVVREYGEEGL